MSISQSLAVLAVLAGGACNGLVEDAESEPPDADITSLPSHGDTYTPSAFTDSHLGHEVLVNRCSHLMRIAGSEPAEPGRYPLAIFLVGTNGRFDSPGIVDHVLPLLASHGFVAASVEYENGTLFGIAQECALYRSNASCLVRNENDGVAGNRMSALAMLCGRAKADCGKGVVVLGHSQGGLTALQMFQFAPAPPSAGQVMPRLVAAAPMGIGTTIHLFGFPIVPMDGCVAAPNLAVDPSKLLVVNGENDEFFNGRGANQAGGQATLETVTGRRCASPTWDCRGPDGDGYVLVRPAQTSTGQARHAYMQSWAGDFAEQNWVSPQNAESWSLASTARWLRAQTP
jgi:hypothetical protein